MDSSQVLALFDRPIAFHPGFVALTGSVNAALMLSQAFYWAKRTRHPDGWFYKSQEDWTKEIHLTRREQESARKLLRATGFWEEVRKGNPAKMHFRVDVEAFALVMMGESCVQTSMAESAIHDPVEQSTKAPLLNGGNVHTPRARPISRSETTTETTPREPSCTIEELEDSEPLVERGLKDKLAAAYPDMPFDDYYLKWWRSRVAKGGIGRRAGSRAPLHRYVADIENFFSICHENLNRNGGNGNGRGNATDTRTQNLIDNAAIVRQLYKERDARSGECSAENT